MQTPRAVASSSFPNERPTNARYWVVVFALTLAILSYFDRVCLSVTLPAIKKTLGLTEEQRGFALAAFGLAYALFEVPGGFLGDWLGPKKVLIRIVLWWSFFTASRGFVWNFGSLAVMQVLFGAGEAGCFPNLTKAFSAWLRKDERLRIQGVMWAFARWGGAFTPFIVISILQWLAGLNVPETSRWRYPFVFFGVLGIVWCVWFARWFKNKPSEHPGVNAAELALLKDVDQLGAGHAHVPWAKLVRSRTVWLLWVQYFCLSFPWYFYITYLASYLAEARHLTEGEIKYYAMVPLLFGGFGSLFAGMLASRLARWVGNVAMSRRILCSVGFAGGAFFMTLVIFTKDVRWAMLAMGLASFSNDLVMPGAWGTCMDIGGRFAGTLSGSMNMMGNLAGFAAPALGGLILGRYHDYTPFLWVMAAMYAAGMFVWPFIDPVTSLDTDDAARA